jgi:hypothetical protein
LEFLQAYAERRLGTFAASCHFVAYQPEKPPAVQKDRSATPVPLQNVMAASPTNRQLRSMTRSSFLLRIQESPRNTTSSATDRLEEASLKTFSETWPKA